MHVTHELSNFCPHLVERILGLTVIISFIDFTRVYILSRFWYYLDFSMKKEATKERNNLEVLLMNIQNKNWFKHFKEGDANIKYGLRCGRSSVVNNESLLKVLDQHPSSRIIGRTSMDTFTNSGF